MASVNFLNENKIIECEIGTNLRQLAYKNKINLYCKIDSFFNCRGNGLCGTCRVEVVDGKGVSPMQPIEEGSMMGWIPWYVRSVSKNHRLACQIEIKNDCQVKSHPEVTIDREATQERRKLFFAVSFFGGIFTIMMLFMLMDLIKIL